MVANWQLMGRTAQAPAGAAVKADCYGLGCDGVVEALAAAGCADFFVATLSEGMALRQRLAGVRIHILNGVNASERPACEGLGLTPVLNTPEQVAAWRGSPQPCDVMLDTGINRLGLDPKQQAGLSWSGLTIDLVMSHFSSADEPDAPATAQEAAAFADRATAVPAARRSLANSAGIAAGAAYGHDLTRPGLALYGGQPWAGAFADLRTPFTVRAAVLQVRDVPAGAAVGYNRTWQAERRTRVATLGIGYADGYRRAFSNRGTVMIAGVPCPVIGRISMDLTTVDVSAVPEVRPGDPAIVLGGPVSLWQAAAASGLSQYELLTGLGPRYARSVEGAVRA